MRDIIGITVEEALNLEKLKDVEILAGMKGLNRHIIKINIMEVPDILDWVEEGELLITTLYSIKDDEKALKGLIPGLAEKKLAGLGIKPERYVKQIPEFMLNQAEDYEFPLLKIPYNFSFSELMNPILSQILNVQNRFLEKTLNIHEVLTDIIPQGLDKLSSELVKIINNPVMIVDSNHNILARKIPEKYSSENFSLIINKNSIKGVEEFNYQELTVEIAGREVRQIKLPIITSNSLFGYLYTWEFTSRLNRLDMATLKWASTIAALNIINQQAVSEVEGRYRNELLYDVLKGKIKERDTILQRGKLMDWDFDKGYQVILIELKELVNKYISEKRIMSQNIQKRTLDAVNMLKKPKVICGDLGTYIIILYPCGVDQDLTSEIKNYIRRVLRVFSREEKEIIYIGVGEFISDIMNINKSYLQAKRAINVAHKINNKDKKIYFFDELGFYQLLYKVNKNNLDLFLENTIASLIQYDKDHNTELVKTLRKYFEENGNLSNIAKSLFIHYNTALYRVQRIEKITGFMLNNSDDRLNLEVALKMLSLDTEGEEN